MTSASCPCIMPLSRQVLAEKRPIRFRFGFLTGGDGWRSGEDLGDVQYTGGS